MCDGVSDGTLVDVGDQASLPPLRPVPVGRKERDEGKCHESGQGEERTGKKEEEKSKTESVQVQCAYGRMNIDGSLCMRHGHGHVFLAR